MGAAKFSKNAQVTCGAGVCRAKSYCAQSVWVCQNWLRTNTLQIYQTLENFLIPDTYWYKLDFQHIPHHWNMFPHSPYILHQLCSIPHYHVDHIDHNLEFIWLFWTFRLIELLKKNWKKNQQNSNLQILLSSFFI